ncbi:MAG: MinD/ParA family protein [Defluviitaleaceae bacterium]|nr:MinD/ParA family protein [Defluviitaleaceae bacterium]
MDQADRLRGMLNFRGESALVEAPSFGARVIAVTSGKGGVGKTNFTINLGLFLQRQGFRVIVLDADLGLANIEILLGVAPERSLLDVLNDRCNFDEAITRLEGNLGFISGGSGLAEMANANEDTLGSMVEKLSQLDNLADIVLIDTGAGISNSVLKFVVASRESIVVCAPEPTSITDAYSLMKSVKERGGHVPQFKIVVNRADDRKEGDAIFKNLHKVSQRFLEMEIEHLGTILFDQSLVKAVKQQKPCLLSFPNSSFTREIEKIGSILIDKKPTKEHGMKGFVKRLGSVFGK